jgi:hypothetical protein
VANHGHRYNTEASQRHTYARTAEAFGRTTLAFSCDLDCAESQVKTSRYVSDDLELNTRE